MHVGTDRCWPGHHTASVLQHLPVCERRRLAASVQSLCSKAGFALPASLVSLLPAQHNSSQQPSSSTANEKRGTLLPRSSKMLLSQAASGALVLVAEPATTSMSSLVRLGCLISCM